MKKIMTVVLVCMMAVGTALTASANFNDVALGHKNSQAISFLKDAGVIGGYADGSFKPNEKLNRAQLMKILVEGQGITPDPAQYKNCFTDVQEQWFAPYVCYAKEVGWVEGLEDGSFKPESRINKAQAIKMTIESQGFAENKETCNRDLFKDTEAAEWYGKYVCVALEKGLLEEDESGNYVPTGELTRAQVSENIYRSILVRKLDKAAYTEEVKGMVVEGLTAFKEEKESIKSEIDSFKAELKAMEEAGSTEEEIKAMREEFWSTVKEAQKANRAEFQAKIKASHDAFKENKDAVKEEMKACKEQKLRYSFTEDKCVEKPVEVEDSVDASADDVNDDTDPADDTVDDEDGDVADDEADDDENDDHQIRLDAN
ncbi:MAG: S-layer homology domain-containing protein [Candidatus Gracilibacteria bacterium]